MGRVDKPTRSLEPRLNAMGARQKIPAKDDRSNADAAKGSTAKRENTGYGLPPGRGAVSRLGPWGRRIRLPQRHDIPAKLKLAAQNSGMNHRCNGLGQLKTTPEKFEIRAIAYARAPVEKRPIFPALVRAHPGNRIVSHVI